MNTKLLLGALAGAITIAAVPSAAHAAATCSYDAAKRTATIQYGATDSSVTVVNRGAIQFSEAGGFMRSCGAATTANTNKVSIKASANPLGFQNTIIDERNGDFSDSNPNLRFSVLTGSGSAHDRLTIRQGAGNDNIRLREQTGLAFGPAVDLDFDGDDDITMLGTEAVVEVFGGNDLDFLDASLASSYQVILHGEDGADDLFGGRKPDLLEGGAGNDRLFGRGDGLRDNLFGGTGTDKADFDHNVDTLNSIEGNTP
jgi:hypothetical protein